MAKSPASEAGREPGNTVDSCFESIKKERGKDMQLDIELSLHEIDLILMWSEKTISGGHWGDGDVLFTDEARILDKLNDLKRGGHHHLTALDVDVILGWMRSHCGHGPSEGLSLSAEEERLVRKMRNAVEKAQSERGED